MSYPGVFGDIRRSVELHGNTLHTPQLAPSASRDVEDEVEAYLAYQAEKVRGMKAYTAFQQLYMT